MMKTKPLPKSSKLYAERAFREKAQWRIQRQRMSFARKLEALDRLLESAQDLPKIRPVASEPGDSPQGA